MNYSNRIVLVMVAGLVIVAGYWVAHHFFSGEARRERRRRRSNSPVASTAKRPMVKFSVHTKEKRRK